MSPPLRFKAVCTKTGREFGVDDLLCNGPMKDKCDFVIDPPIGLEYAIEFEGAHEAKNVEICQSTGLKDSQGKEVFFGDVLLIYFPETDTGYFYSVYFERAGFKLEGFYLPEQVRPQGQRHWLSVELLLDFIEDGKKVFVLGNRWEPIETLKRRAEAANIDKYIFVCYNISY